MCLIYYAPWYEKLICFMITFLLDDIIKGNNTVDIKVTERFDIKTYSFSLNTIVVLKMLIGWIQIFLMFLTVFNLFNVR